MLEVQRLHKTEMEFNEGNVLNKNYNAIGNSIPLEMFGLNEKGDCTKTIISICSTAIQNMSNISLIHLNLLKNKITKKVFGF